MEKIVILHTDVPSCASLDEQDTLVQAESVAQALLSLGFQPVMLPFTLDLNFNIRKLHSEAPLAVFNLVETLSGQGNMISFATALLDYLQIPYTGCRTESLFLTSDKPLAKNFLLLNGIDTPFWLTADGKTHGNPLSDTFILKASWEEASFGLDDTSILRCSDISSILNAIGERKKKTGLDFFAESFIFGREFNVALLSSEHEILLLPPSEILFENYPADKYNILDYPAKWLDTSFEYHNTKRCFDFPSEDSALLDRIKEIALSIWQRFSLRGYARVDFRVDSFGRPWVLEINANPCLSPDAGFAAALEYAGIKYAEAIKFILLDALKFYP